MSDKNSKNTQLPTATDVGESKLVFDSVTPPPIDNEEGIKPIFDSATTIPVDVRKHVEHVRVTKPFSEFKKEKRDERFIKNFEFKEENVKKAKNYIKALDNLLKHKNILGEKTTIAMKKNRRHLIKAIKTKDGVKLKEGMFEYLSLLASIYSVLKGAEDGKK